MSQLYAIWTQFFPPAPPLKRSNLPNQAGKVFIVTGGSSGVGFELAKMLYSAGGTVYIMTHHEARALEAIQSIQASAAATPTSSLGILKFVRLDLADLSTISTAVATFRTAENRLDVLWNNAGVASVPLETKTAQDLEPHFGVNCVGHFLLTKLLLPVLATTAKQSPANSVRIIWTSSILVDLMAPKGGVRISELSNPSNNRNEHYSASKAGNWLLASEYARRFGNDTGVVSITQNPGSLKTNVWRTTPRRFYWPYYLILSKAVDGACTELWTGLSGDITTKDGGRYAIPFGRWHPSLREDIMLALKDRKDGGTGEAVEFWDWCEEAVKPYV